ncbi:MAG: ABC transporter permease [Acidobacteriaceae bacterium]|nr:ABC transporter permease [Acidobacteriaceae bacterium]
MQDMRYAVRAARKNAVTTAAAFAALTLGIGATTAIFSVVNHVLLRPLPVKDEQSIVRLFESDARSERDFISMPDFLDWKRHLKSFSGLALYRFDQANLTAQGPAERVRMVECDAGLLPLLGVSPIVGRNFSPREDEPGAEDVVLLSWAFWQSHFGGRSVTGHKIILDGNPYTIVGVLPPNFLLFGNREIWIPVSFDLSLLPNTRGRHWYWGLGRLRRNVSLEQANAELRAEAAALAAAYPKENRDVAAQAIPLRDVIAGNARPALLMLLGAGTCVLLIACGNIANLALARASGRHREIAIRIALGASRARLFRQLLTENILLSVAAAIAGLAFAAGTVRLLRSLPDTRIPNPEDIHMDWRVLVFASAAAIVTGILFGLAPAFHASMARVQDALKQASGRLTESKFPQRIRRLFVFLQAAVAALLLIQSALLVKSYEKASNINPGFNAGHLLTVEVSLPSSHYAPGHVNAIDHFARSTLQNIRLLPGVRNAAITANLPMTGTGGGGGLLIEGEAAHKNPADAIYVQWTRVTPGYFRTMGIRRVAGRDFDERDDAGARSVVIVNKAFVRQILHGEDPLGRRVAIFADKPEWREIVGVMTDVPQLEMEKKALPEIFFPLAQMPVPWLAITIGTEGDPLRYVNAVRAAVQEVDPEVAAFLPRTMEQIMQTQLGWRGFQTGLVTAFAAIALVLACVGVYATIAYSVTQRVTEIGVRLALGAQKRDVLSAVIVQGAGPALAGTVVGALLALAMSRALAQLLYGVQPLDRWSYALGIGILFGVALLASYLPARRAAALDPSQALRNE